MCVYQGVQLKFKPDLPRHDDVAALFVIAQQYSSATFVALRFDSGKENFDVLLMRLFTIFYFLNCIFLGIFEVSNKSQHLSLGVFFSSSPVLPFDVFYSVRF